MSEVSVNDKHIFKFEEKDGIIFLDDQKLAYDIQVINPNTFHLLHENKSYTAEVVSMDRPTKMGVLKINGNEYTVVLKDQFDMLLANMGMNLVKKSNTVVLKAPMPGLVLKIIVNVGDILKKGDDLLILEAMKMENIIKSSEDVVVKSIDVKKGAIVEKNQVLLTFE